MVERRLIGLGVFLLVALWIYLLSPRYWRHAGDDDTPGFVRAMKAVGGVQEVILYLIVLGIAVAYVVMGNQAGRLIGVGLLVPLLVVGARFLRRHRLWTDRD